MRTCIHRCDLEEPLRKASLDASLLQDPHLALPETVQRVEHCAQAALRHSTADATMRTRSQVQRMEHYVQVAHVTCDPATLLQVQRMEHYVQVARFGDAAALPARRALLAHHRTHVGERAVATVDLIANLGTSLLHCGASAAAAGGPAGVDAAGGGGGRGEAEGLLREAMRLMSDAEGLTARWFSVGNDLLLLLIEQGRAVEAEQLARQASRVAG